MKIQELAERSGLSAHTIRFYEKEGLLDSRHVQREENNYRNYGEEAIERLRLIKKFQSVGCSLNELKDILHEQDTTTPTHAEVIEWILQKMSEIEHKKDELDQMLVTLNWMLDYRTAMMHGDKDKMDALLAIHRFR